MAYEDDDQLDGFVPWEPPQEERVQAAAAADDPENAPPYQVAGGWQPPPTRGRESLEGFVPWEPPQQQQQQVQPQASGGLNGFVPWEPPQERPEAEGVIGTAAREAAGATPATLGGLAAGAGAAGVGRVAGAALGRAIGGLGGTLGGPAGTVAGWIGGGLVGGYIGEELAKGIKSFLGFDDTAQRQANVEANPIAAAAGQVAPLALGLSPGSGAQTVNRLLSGGIGGAIEGATQIAEGEFSPARLGANIAAGAALPGNRAWLSRLEASGVKAAGGRLGEAQRAQAAAEPQQPPWPEKTWPEGAPGPTPDWPGGMWPEGEPIPARPERPTPPPGEAPVWPDSTWPNEEPQPSGRTDRQGFTPGGRYEEPRPGTGYEEPARPSLPPADTPVAPHGTPGSEGPAGTAQAQPPPVEGVAGPEMTRAGGPEDWSKKTAPAEGGNGINVGDVDPTLAHTLKAETPAATQPAQQAGPMADLDARLNFALHGEPGGPKRPAAEVPGELRKIAADYEKMGQPGQVQKIEQVARAIEANLPPEPARTAALKQPQDVLKGPAPAVEPATKTGGEQRTPVATSGEATGVLPEKQPFYEAAKAAAPNLPEAQLTHIANLAGGPKGAALMARNAARRMAEDVGAPAARVAEVERAPVPERPIERSPVEARPEETIAPLAPEGTPTPESFWSYKPAERPLNYESLPEGVFRGTKQEWESFSPGMRREIVRDAQRVAEREQRQQQQQQQPPRPSSIGEEAFGSPPGKPPSGQPPRPPPPPPPPGGTPPSLGAHPPVTAPAVAPARRFETARAAVDKVVRRWQETFQPETIDPKALSAEPLFRKMKSARSGERDRVFHNTQEGEKRWNASPEDSRYKFLSDVENGRTVKLEQQADATNLKRMLQEAHEMEKEAGLKAAYRENYFPHEWEKSRPGQVPIMEHLQSLGPNWFQKARTIDLIEEGIRAGYKLKNSNPYAAVRSRLMAGADLRMQKGLLDDLRTMGMAGHAEEGTSARLTRMGYQAVNGPDGKQWMLAPEIQPLWKNAISGKSLWSDPNLTGDAFRGWMQFKAFWVPIKLSLSGFHALHVGHINFSSNLARAADQAIAGDIIGAARSMGEAFTTTFRPKATVGGKAISSKDVQAQWLLGENARTPEGKLAIQHMEEGGFVPHMSEQLRSDARTRLDEAWRNKNPFGLAIHGPRELVRLTSSPMFETWIPRVKTSAYLNDVAALLQRKPELNSDPVARRIALSAVAKSIDNRFGEMFYDGLFWNRMVKDTGIGSFLSLGWNLGFAREFGGAALESVTRPAGKIIPGIAPSAERQIIRDATNKIKFASIYMGTAMMIGGMMTKMFTGENPSEVNDYIFPRINGTNPDGSPRRLTTMFYTREAPMLGKHIEEHGGGFGGTLAGMGGMLWNKLLFQPFVELAQNKSYYGSEIWNPHSPGYEQVMQFGRHVFGQQFLPMTITGAQQIEEKGGQPFEKALAFAGFGPAPAYADRSATQNYIAHLYRQHVAPADRPYQDPDVSNEQRAARNKVLMAIQRGDQPARTAAYKEAITAGLKPEQLSKLGRTYSDQNMFQRLPQTDQMHILENATPEEHKRYWPHASNKTRIQWQKDHPGRTQ